MSTINIFRSVFTTQPETVSISERKAIRDCVSLDFENSIIFVNGFQKDENYVLCDDDVCTIRVMPAGGTPVGDFFDFVWDKVTDFASWAWGNVQDFFKWALGIEEPDIPSNKARDSLQSIPTLTGAKNQGGYNKAIPMALGRIFYTPIYCGNPYHTLSGVDGEHQTYHVLYMLGYNDIQVTDFKLGVVDLAHNTDYTDKDGTVHHVTTVDNGDILINGRWDGEKNGIHLELQQGDNEVSLYPQKVVEESLGIELIHTSDDKEVLECNRFSAKYPQKIEIELTLEGLIGYDNSGKAQSRSVSVKMEISFDGGVTYEPFNTYNTTGQDVSCDSNGVYTITRSKNKVMRFAMERILSYSEGIDCANRIAELRIKRTNAKNGDNRTSDTVYLSAIRTWCYDYEKSKATEDDENYEETELIPQVPLIKSRRNMTARLGLQIDANNTDFKNQLDALNCIITAKGKTWNGTEWLDSHTPNSNPASMALRLLEHESRGRYRYGFNYLDKIDYGSFGEFYEWCNQSRSENDSTPKFQCNGIITSAKKTRDILDGILMVGRAKLILNERRYGVWIDKPRPTSVMILNAQNVLSASNSKSFEDLPDGYKTKFVNEMTWQTDEIKCMLTGTETPGMVFESTELSFQTDVKQVFQNSKYMLACKKLRRETWNRKVSVDGNLLDIGSKVEIQDDTIAVGIGEGAEIKELVIEGNYITGIKTDGHFIVSDPNLTYGIRCTCADGNNAPKIMAWNVFVPGTGMVSDFTFVNPILKTADYKPNVGDIISFGLFQHETTEALCFGKKDNGDGTFDLTLVPYQEAIYTADEDGVSVDDLVFDSKVTDIPQNTGGDYVIDETKGLIARNTPRFIELLAPEGTSFKNGVPDSVVLECLVTGFTPASYRWYKDNNLIPNENGDSIEIDCDDVNGSAVYKVEADHVLDDLTKIYTAYITVTSTNETKNQYSPCISDNLELSDGTLLELSDDTLLSVEPWHDLPQEGDRYMRTSNDGGHTWSDAVLFVGKDGGFQDYKFAVGAFDLTQEQLQALDWQETAPATTEQAPCLYMATKWIEGE